MKHAVGDPTPEHPRPQKKKTDISNLKKNIAPTKENSKQWPNMLRVLMTPNKNGVPNISSLKNYHPYRPYQGKLEEWAKHVESPDSTLKEMGSPCFQLNKPSPLSRATQKWCSPCFQPRKLSPLSRKTQKLGCPHFQPKKRSPLPRGALKMDQTGGLVVLVESPDEGLEVGRDHRLSSPCAVVYPVANHFRRVRRKDS